MAKVTRPSIVNIDPTLLSDEEKDQLVLAAKERVAKERHDATMDDFLKRAIDNERRAHDPRQEMKYIQLDMAGHSDRIMLDGTVYFQGQTYLVPKNIYDTMAEVIGRGWEHEHAIGGSNSRYYQKPRSTTIGPRDVGRAAHTIGAV